MPADKNAAPSAGSGSKPVAVRRHLTNRRVVIGSTFLVALTLTLALLAWPRHAQAGAATVFHFTDGSVGATFSSSSPDGCVRTDVFVAAVEVKNQGNAAQQSPFAALSLSEFNNCTNTQLLSADGQANTAGFQFDRQLRTATLITTLPVTDFVSNTTFNVALDLSWTGTGDVVRQTGHTSHSRSPGFNVYVHSNGTSRTAIASGTVSDGTTNFTPSATTDASIAFITIGRIEITHT
jgi:hypothetical protein